MKKILLVVALLTVVFAGRMACTATEKANVSAETVTYEETEQEERIIEELYRFTEEEILELKEESLADIYSEWDYYIDEGWSEEGLYRIIEVIESIEYDASYPIGYNLESTQKRFVNILVDEGFLDELCRGMTFDELESFGVF